MLEWIVFYVFLSLYELKVICFSENWGFYIRYFKLVYMDEREKVLLFVINLCDRLSIVRYWIGMCIVVLLMK